MLDMHRSQPKTGIRLKTANSKPLIRSDRDIEVVIQSSKKYLRQARAVPRRGRFHPQPSTPLPHLPGEHDDQISRRVYVFPGVSRRKKIPEDFG
jgi:hypothetical protein